MSKFRHSIVVFGILIVIIAASLLTVLVLYATGAIVTDPVELVFSVSDVEKEYDGTPLRATEYELVSGELPESHRAVVEILGERTDAGVSASDLSVKIYNGKGFDVSDDYAVKVQKGKISVLPGEITVRLNDAEIEYSGDKIFFDDYEVTKGSLVGGHIVGGELQGTGLLSAGDKLPDNFVPSVYDVEGKDVSGNYKINFIRGEVVITPRRIAVKPADVSKVYDGSPLVLKSSDYVVLSGSFPEGHSAEMEFNNGEAEITSADSLRTYISDIKVYDAKGVDVTENYEFDYSELGLMTVTRRDLTITAKSRQWVYDGTAHSFAAEDDNQPLTVEGLAPGDEVYSVEYSGTRTDFGVTENKIVSVEFSGDRDTQYNYNVKYVPGVVEVTKLVFTLSLEKLEVEYTGDNFEFTDAVFEGCVFPEILSSADFTVTSYTPVVNEGTYLYTAALVDATKAKNIDLTVNPGTIVINKKSVTLAYTGGDINKIYDGAPAAADLTHFSLGGENDARFAVTKVECDKLVNVAYVGGAVASSLMRVSNPRIFDRVTGADVTGNFTVTSDVGIKVTISPRPLYIILSDYEYAGSTLPQRIDDDVLLGLVNVSGATPVVTDDILEYEVDYAANINEISVTITAIYNTSLEIVTANYVWQNSDVTSKVILQG